MSDNTRYTIQIKLNYFHLFLFEFWLQSNKFVISVSQSGTILRQQDEPKPSS